MKPLDPEARFVTHSSDIHAVRTMARRMAEALGFSDSESEEISLVTSELATNLIRHAGSGTISLNPLVQGRSSGIRIEALDDGPGIADADQAATDGFSTSGSLGYGLGTVHRLMDSVEIGAAPYGHPGTQIVCTRWKHQPDSKSLLCPLSIGAATRPHPNSTVNGDAFVIKKWAGEALAAVIDGLGHGPFAHRAASSARNYLERHYDQPLDGIFRGVERMCRATRGVVMAVAGFDWEKGTLTFGSIGNVTARIFGSSDRVNLMVRRGVLGLGAPNPVVTVQPWNRSNVMVLHSDGVKSNWRWEDFDDVHQESASDLALEILRRLNKGIDDATVVVVKAKEP